MAFYDYCAIMEMLQVAKMPLMNDKTDIPIELKKSKMIYICNKWSKLCFVLLICIIFILREMILLLAESNIVDMFAILQLNNKSRT